MNTVTIKNVLSGNFLITLHIFSLQKFASYTFFVTNVSSSKMVWDALYRVFSTSGLLGYYCSVRRHYNVNTSHLFQWSIIPTHIILHNFDTSVLPWHKFKNSITVQIWHMHSSQFTKQPFPLPYYYGTGDLPSVDSAAETYHLSLKVIFQQDTATLRNTCWTQQLLQSFH